MTSKKAMEVVILLLWFFIAASLFFVDKQKQIISDPPIEQFDNDEKIETVQKFDVKKIVVISSNSYDFTLKDEKNTRILAKLSVLVTEDAKQKIIDLLNNVETPKVKLKEKQEDGKWIVDLFYTVNGQEQSFSSWLEEKNLVYKQ